MSIKCSVKEHSIVTHAQRDIDPHEMRELWTEHKIVLIAYEAQFMYARRQSLEGKNTPPTAEKEQHCSSVREETKRKRQDNRSSKMQNQSSFIYVDQGSELQIDARKELASQEARWPILTRLLNQSQKDLFDIAKMVEVLIEIKHPAIVNEFMDIYEIIVDQILATTFIFEEEASRREWEVAVADKILRCIQERRAVDKDYFPYFSSYLYSDKISFRKFLVVTAYCLLAERFNFSINEYYCDAFSHYEEEGLPEKRPKIEVQEQ